MALLASELSSRFGQTTHISVKYAFYHCRVSSIHMRITLDQAVARLQAGDVVAIPTETVYGLAADARNDTALAKIYALKKRPANNPLIVHIADISQVSAWASRFSPLAQTLARAFWPGPFTLVLPAQAHVSNILRANAPTVALRVPSHPLAHQLLALSGLSLAAPSANQYTHLSPTKPQHVEASLGIDVPVLDGGACQVGIESTIVSVHDDMWQLLRHGMISEVDITKVAGQPALTTMDASNRKEAIAQPKAPGQHHLHYAPRTPTYLFEHAHTLQEKLNAFSQTHHPCAVLAIGDTPMSDGPRTIVLNKAAAHVAEALYTSLHQLDALNAEAILVLLPPNTPAWAAIRDRLSRAGHHQKL